jgi:hypothetical protein
MTIGEPVHRKSECCRDDDGSDLAITLLALEGNPGGIAHVDRQVSLPRPRIVMPLCSRGAQVPYTASRRPRM